MKTLFPLLLLHLFSVAAPASIRVASYNVENLFDLHKEGTEYTEYIPYTGYGWNDKAFAVKVANIARVICDMKPDIIGLQEIESDRALAALQKGVRRCGWPMPYRAVADRKPTVVKTALLSRHPIVRKSEIDPDGSLKTRDILEVTVKTPKGPLTLFVNHWKSRSGPESRRLVSAVALMKRLKALPRGTDYVVLGDFNSDWREWRTLPRSPRLNDTRGVTGINHILRTVVDGKPVTKRTIRRPEHYDLWYELPPRRRWSHNFYGHKTALDHMLLPASMFDGRGIDYVDKSFHKFTPYYLFTAKGALYRWQVAKHRRGKHLDRGFSDHLPIYALFDAAPYRSVAAPQTDVSGVASVPSSSRRIVHIADLYETPLGWTNLTLPLAVVIYKRGKNAILKEPGGRAILVYGDTGSLKVGHAYRLTVRKLYDYRGLREVTKLGDVTDLGKRDIRPLMLQDVADLNDPNLVNEVVGEISGRYKRGYLYYAKGRRIRLYVKNRKRKPKNGSEVTLKRVRISIYRQKPELVVE